MLLRALHWGRRPCWRMPVPPHSLLGPADDRACRCHCLRIISIGSADVRACRRRCLRNLCIGLSDDRARRFRCHRTPRCLLPPNSARYAARRPPSVPGGHTIWRPARAILRGLARIHVCRRFDFMSVSKCHIACDIGAIRCKQVDEGLFF